MIRACSAATILRLVEMSVAAIAGARNGLSHHFGLRQTPTNLLHCNPPFVVHRMGDRSAK